MSLRLPHRKNVVAVMSATMVLALGERASSATAPLRIVATVARASVRFGDPVTVRVDVAYRPGTIDPSSIRVVPSFAPYAQASNAVVRRPAGGVSTYTYSLLCVTEGCLPAGGPKLLHLGPVTVTAETGTGTLRASTAGPTLRVVSRLAGRDLSGRVRFRSPQSPPSPSYRIEPGSLAAALILAAAICALVASTIVLRELTRHVRRSTGPHLSTLDLAIAYVRDSITRSGPDRRRALALLAEAADTREPSLAASAAATAWARPSPSPVGAAELADRAARVEGSDG